MRSTAALIGFVAAGSLGWEWWLEMHEVPPQGPGQALWGMLRYFTILTNVIVAIAMMRIAVGIPPRAPLIGGVTLWIAIVGVVYHLLLAVPHVGPDWWTDFGLHTVVPVATIVWWIAFAPVSGLRWRHAALWTLWPFAYAAYALMRGHLDGQFPYFFVNPVQVGWQGVLLWTCALAVCFWIGGLTLIAMSRMRFRPT